MWREKIREILAEHAFIRQESINDLMTLRGDLMLDSLRFANCIVEVEKQLKLKLPMDVYELSDTITVGDLFELLEPYYGV